MVDTLHFLLLQLVVLTIFFCSVVFASVAPFVPTQPHQNELAWSTEACEEAGLDAEQVSRMSGGCAKLTFCNRGSSYSSGIYGYRVSAPAGTTTNSSSGGECLSPGPVMRMKPGKTYGLILCSEGGSGHPGANLHTHGLHISGSGNSDDITRLIFPDSCGFYEYAIPEDHMGGTSWYHPHVMGRTLEQASGGAFGLVVIEDRPRDLTVDPSVGSETDRDAVYDFLTDLDRELFILAAFSGGKWINSNQDMNDTSMEYNIKVDIWYRLRILAVSPDAKPETVIFPPECDAYALAYDGVYIFNPPRARLDAYKMTGASRLDVALKCTVVGIFQVANTDGWSPSLPGGVIAWHGQGWEGLPSIATLVVSDVDSSSNNTSTTWIKTGPFLSDGLAWKSYRPNHLRDLRNVTVVDNTWSIDMGQYGKLNGLPYNIDCPLKDSNGQNFKFESVQEWIHTSVQMHPAHVHVYHQQVIGSGCGEGHDVGEYYDTIADGGNGIDFQDDSCRVRFQMLDVGGRVTLHCHNLRHEDSGMMGWVHVENGGPTTNTEPCCISGFCSPCVNERNLPDQCEAIIIDGGGIVVPPVDEEKKEDADCNCTMCDCSEEEDTSGSSINKSILQTQCYLLILLLALAI
jgi:FtsP/CotA-like multicopper oxidase with cupredoxin domain